MSDIKIDRGGYEDTPSEKKWTLVNFCELDKYAIKSYCAIHNVSEELNLGDITTVDPTKIADFDMMTWGFPCTDISISGKQKGFKDEEGNTTRSGLYYEGIRILREKKPKISIIENVKNLVGKRFKKEFESILNDLDEAGYNSYWKVLNAKDYGVPQNRERVYIISIRKDVDNGKFVFPEGFDNGKRLKDVLEDEVDEKFYINTPKAQKLIEDLIVNGKLENPFSEKQGKKRMKDKVIQLGNVTPISTRTNPNQGRVYDIRGLSPTLNTMGGGNRQPMIVVKDNRGNIK
jgi:DNA (cytosine-5)-methyltransferase 1